MSKTSQTNTQNMPIKFQSMHDYFDEIMANNKGLKSTHSSYTSISGHGDTSDQLRAYNAVIGIKSQGIIMNEPNHQQTLTAYAEVLKNLPPKPQALSKDSESGLETHDISRHMAHEGEVSKTLADNIKKYREDHAKKILNQLPKDVVIDKDTGYIMTKTQHEELSNKIANNNFAVQASLHIAAGLVNGESHDKIAETLQKTLKNDPIAQKHNFSKTDWRNVVLNIAKECKPDSIGFFRKIIENVKEWLYEKDYGLSKMETLVTPDITKTLKNNVNAEVSAKKPSNDKTNNRTINIR